MNMNFSFLHAWLGLFVFCGSLLAAPALQPVGGGFTDAGLRGEYFANATLSGAPQFARKDIRINFDWGELLPVGGSTAPAFRDFPRDNFSIRWQGQIVSRFTEDYTFEAISDEGVRLYLKPAGAPAWTTLVDNWTPHALATNTTTVALTNGLAYDIMIEYFNLSSIAVMRLWWSSPSTPREVVDALAVALSGGQSYLSAMLADAAREARWLPLNTYDDASAPIGPPNGWPTNDARALVTAPVGRKFLQFNGMAQVDIAGAYFRVGAAVYTNRLPSGVGYSAGSNMTVVAFDSNADPELRFTRTQRDGAAPTNTGITNVKCMQPVYTGATNHHAVGEVICRAYREAFAQYAVIRDISPGFCGLTNWSQRSYPGYAKHTRPGGDDCLEEWIMLANESGHDLYMTMPAAASDDYFTKFAQLARYGSDGMNPYTTYTPNPVYPPLNPNLRIYLEYSNETWLFPYQNGICQVASRDAVTSNTPDGQIVNYDGAAISMGDWPRSRRWHALRTVRYSQAFRNVFGDEAMGDRVRVVVMGQYGGITETYLQFIDNYFNNGDGSNHVPSAAWPYPPQPVSYYLWAGGGALYFAGANPLGENTDCVVSNAGFETPDVATGTATNNPIESGWTFTGNAGICDFRVARPPAVTNETPGPTTSGSNVWVGCKFTVGSKDIFVFEVGRWKLAGNNQTHTVKIVDQSGNVIDYTWYTYVEMTNQPAAQYVFRPTYRIIGYGKSLPRPIRLIAGTTYYIFSQEFANGDTYAGLTPVLARAGVSIDSAAMYSGSGSSYTLVGGSNTVFGPVNFKFTDTPLSTALGPLAVPADPTYETNDYWNGSNLYETQCAFIAGTGTISRTVTVNATGQFAIVFRAMNSQVRGNSIRIYFDNGLVLSNWAPGVWEKPSYNFYHWSSHLFVNMTPGEHLLRFAGQDPVSNSCIFIDTVAIGSLDAFYGGPGITNFCVNGRATGQNPNMGQYGAVLKSEADDSLSWGLKTASYEGGWAVACYNSDSDRVFLYDDAAWWGAGTAAVQMKAMDIYSLQGGVICATYYGQFATRDAENATNYALVRGVMQYNQRWPAEGTNGWIVPCTLAPAQKSQSGSPSGAGQSTSLAPFGWMTWNLVIPATANYQVKTTTAAGGTVRVSADECMPVSAGASGGTLTGTVYLTKGLHSVKVKSLGGATFAMTSLTITALGQPPMTVLGYGRLIADGNTTPQALDGTDFGSATVHLGTVSHVFTIANFGESNLVLGSAPRVFVTGAATSEFLVTAQPAAMIAPGSNSTFSISYMPGVLGDVTATVVISNSFDVANPYDFTIRGNGVPEPVLGLLWCAGLLARRLRAARAICTPARKAV